MPKCDSCGVFYDDPGDLEFVRNKENRWVPICRPCQEKGVDVNLVAVRNIAVEEAVLRMADKPGIDVNLVGGDPVASARKLLQSLRTLRQVNEKEGRVRNHTRHSFDITIEFTLARDDALHAGVVKNLSQGGMLVHTDKVLTRGQIVQFDWKGSAPPNMTTALQGSAEVRRVTKNNDGTFAIGFRFVKRQVMNGANRRRFRRYRCDMPAYYQREKSNMIRLGRVTDISQGGCQLELDEELAANESFFVRLVGGGGNRGDLIGTMQVRRMIKKEMLFEAGCAFQQMRIERLSDLGKTKNPGGVSAGPGAEARAGSAEKK